jgi:membrane associated rhomboid family serine protease
MVFAALGILGVFSLNARYAYHQRGIRRWLPFVAAIALLGFTGTAGERTDVLAHISGFVSGCVAAVMWLTLGKDKTFSRQHQVFFGVISLFILIFTWTLAIENV